MPTVPSNETKLSNKVNAISFYNSPNCTVTKVKTIGFDTAVYAKESGGLKVTTLSTYDCETAVMAENCDVVDVNDVNMTYSPRYSSKKNAQKFTSTVSTSQKLISKMITMLMRKKY